MLHQKEEIERQILIYLIEDEVPAFDKDKAKVNQQTSNQPPILQQSTQPQSSGSQQINQNLLIPIFSNPSTKAHPSHPSSVAGGHHGNLSNQNVISVQDESCNSVNSFNVAPPTSKMGVDEQVHFEKSTSSTPESGSQNGREKGEIREEKQFKIIDLDCIRYSLQLTGFKYKDANLFCELVKQNYTGCQGLKQEGCLGKFKMARAAIKKSQLYSSIIEFATFNNYIRPKEKPRRKLIENFDMCMQILQKKYPLIILIGGTSGTGKSTLASILASRFQISTVLSTDSIRHIVRNFMDESEEPILFTSTYEAGKCLAEDPSTKEAKRTIQGYKTQCKLVQQRLEKVVAQYANRGEPMIIEGVHLTPRFMFGLMKKHPYVIPFTICIEKESKHRQRFAVRSKYMTLDKKKNKYIQYISNIRMIQGWFMEKSDECLIPKINNVNVDKSVNIIHRVVTTYIHKMIQEDTKQLNEKSLNALLLYQSYNKIVKPLINKLDINQQPNKQLLLQKFIDDLQKEETEKEKIGSNNNIPSANIPGAAVIGAEMNQLGSQLQQSQVQLSQQQQESGVPMKQFVDSQNTDNSALLGGQNSGDSSKVTHFSPIIKPIIGQNLVLDPLSRNNSICSTKTNPKDDRNNQTQHPVVEEFREKSVSGLSAKKQETSYLEEPDQFKEKQLQQPDLSNFKGDNPIQKLSVPSPYIAPMRKTSTQQQEDSLPVKASLPRNSIDSKNENNQIQIDVNYEENQDQQSWINGQKEIVIQQQQNQQSQVENIKLPSTETLQKENNLEPRDHLDNTDQQPRNSTIQLLKKKPGKKAKRRRLLRKEEERSNLVTIHSSHNGEGQSEADSLHIGEDNFEFAVEEDYDEDIDCPEERSNSIDDEDEEDQNNFANQSEDESSDDDNKKLKAKQKMNGIGTTAAAGQEDEEEEDEDEEEDGEDYEDEEDGDEYEDEEDALSSKYIGNVNLDGNQGTTTTQDVSKDKVSFSNIPPEKSQEMQKSSESPNTLKDILKSDDHIQISSVSRRIFLSKSQILHSQTSEESKTDHLHTTTTTVSVADHHKKIKNRFGRHDRQHSFVKRHENGTVSGVSHSASGILLAQTKPIPTNLAGTSALQIKKRSSKHKRISHEITQTLGQIQTTDNNGITDIRAKSCDQEKLKGFKSTSAVMDGEIFSGIPKQEQDSPNSKAIQKENGQEPEYKGASQNV